MIGPDGAARKLAQHLADFLPARIELLRQQQGDVVGGPDAQVIPRLIHFTQVPILDVGVNDWPFLLVIPMQTNRMLLTDTLDDGTKKYDCMYLTRVFVYVRGVGFDQVSSIRGRLLLATREVLLAKPSPGSGIKIEPAEMTEEHSDVATSEELGGSIAASYIDVDLKVAELLSPADPAYDTPQTVEPVIQLAP